jgi:hypothetical protein
MPSRIPARLPKENKKFTTNHFFSDAPDEGGGTELLRPFLSKIQKIFYELRLFAKAFLCYPLNFMDFWFETPTGFTEYLR